MTITAPPTVRCSYCFNGMVHGHGSKPDRRCIPCAGSGRLPAAPCPLCSEPVLDDQTKVWSINGELVDRLGRAVHLACLPITQPEEGQQ